MEDRSHLLTWVLGALAVLAITSAPVSLWAGMTATGSVSIASVATIVAGLLTLVTAYAILRSGRYVPAAYLTVWGLTVAIMVAEVVLAWGDPVPIIAFLTVPLLLSSVLLPTGSTVVLAVATVVEAAALNPLLRASEQASINLILLLVATSVLAIGINRFQERQVATSERQAHMIAEREARFRALAENIEEVFWLTDPEKEEMVYISPAFEAIWGMPSDRLDEDPMAWIEAIHPDDRDRVAEKVPEAQIRGEYDERYRIVQPDGRVRWVRDQAFPVRDADGEVIRLVGFAQDITDQVTLQAQEARSAAEAARREELEKLVWMTSHALRTPVRTVTSFSQLVLRRADGQLPDDAIEDLELVVQGARSLDQLMQDLRSYTEILMRDGHAEVVDTVAAARAALVGLRGQVPLDRAQVDIRDLPSVRGDPVQLRRLFQEGLENAIVHTRAGVNVTAEAEEQRPGWYRFRIEDDGQGLSPEDARTAFQVFQRIDADLSEGHTGLGLPLCQRIVEAHGGRIWIESPVNEDEGAGSGLALCFVLPGAEIEAEDLEDLEAIGDTSIESNRASLTGNETGPGPGPSHLPSDGDGATG